MQYTTMQNGIMLNRADGTKLRLQVYGDKVVRLSCCFGSFSEEPSLMVCEKPWSDRFEVRENDEFITFCTGQLRIKIDKKDCTIQYAGRDGRHLLSQGRYGIELFPQKIEIPHYEMDGAAVGSMKLTDTEVKEGCRFSLRFDFSENEPIYGFGSGTTGRLNRLEKEQYLYQYNYSAPAPFFVSPVGYGVFVDTCAYSTFREDHLGQSFFSEAADMADFYFIMGENLDEVIGGYRRLTGNAPMLPKWFFGYIQSKEHYHTQAELLEIVAEYRRRKIPLDLIVQDWKYWKEDVWSDKSFDPARYPDPAGMCEEVHRQNAHIMISVWPNARGGENQKELWENNLLLGDGEVYNAFDPKAGEVYWKQLQEGIFRHGFDAWWCDCSEPYETAWGDSELTDEERRAVTVRFFKKYIDARKINAYSLVHSRNVYENQRKTTQSKRVVNLTRSGYGGQQRYSGVVWSGDITGTWKELRKQVAEALNFCASGQPYWSVDIGGFFMTQWSTWFERCSIYDEWYDLGYSELYTRWLQFACFLPVMRSHGTHQPREVWRFGEEGGMFYDAIKKFIELRYRLILYNYSLAWRVTSQDYTPLRLLAFDFPGDARALAVTDQFMSGPALMVCPVLRPMYYEKGSTPLDGAAKAREVYLPQGSEWFDFWTGTCYAGGQTVIADAPIEKLPLFVRGGSILPLSPVMQYVDEQPDAPYEIRIYPGADACFTIYEDRGDGYEYEDGAYAVYTLQWTEKDREVTIFDRKGSFDGMCGQRKLIFRLPDQEKEIYYDGQGTKLSFT